MPITWHFSRVSRGNRLSTKSKKLPSEGHKTRHKYKFQGRQQTGVRAPYIALPRRPKFIVSVVARMMSGGPWSWRRRVVRQPHTPVTKAHADNERPKASGGQSLPGVTRPSRCWPRRDSLPRHLMAARTMPRLSRPRRAA